MQKILDGHQYDNIDIFAAKFVKDVLEESYGTTKYFNLKEIVEESKPLIMERIEIIKSDPDITRDTSISWDIGHILPIKINTDFQFNEKYNKILMTYASKTKPIVIV